MNPQGGLIAQLHSQLNNNMPAIDQVGSQSPQFQPGLQPPPEHPMPERSPMDAINQGETALHRHLKANGIPIPANMPGQPQPPMPPVASQVAPQQPIPQSEAELILKALSSRLGLIGKHESSIRDHLFPPQETPKQ